jgi:spore maturation protein CgeB
MVKILSDMLDEQRAQIGRRARERILAEHTSAHRAMEFESVMERVSQRSSAKEWRQREGLSFCSCSKV